MKQFIIERDLQGAGAPSPDDNELRAISQKSCALLAEVGSEVQWQHSYVTTDRIYCAYLAASEELVREHARRGGFPANTVSRLTATSTRPRRRVDPTSAPTRKSSQKRGIE